MLSRASVRAALGVVALSITIWVFVATLGSAPPFEWPSPATAMVALVLIGIGLAAASWSWALLFEGGTEPRRAVAAFLFAQPAKYLPAGGVAQAAGQIGLTQRADFGASRVTALFLIHAGIQVSAGLTVGGLVSFTATQIATSIRLLVGLLLFTPLLVRRSILVRLLTLLTRVFRRTIEPDWVPSQRTLFISLAWSVVPIVASGTALTLLLPSKVSTVSGFAAFGLAWSVGFLALPVPSGLGIREGVLSAVLGVNAAVVIVGSALHRLATLAVEGVGVVIASRMNR